MNKSLLALAIAGSLTAFSNQVPVTQLTSTHLAQINTLNEPIVRIAKEATPAVVFIKVETPAPQSANDPFDSFHEEFFRRFFGPGQRFNTRPQQPQVARGTGFLVTADGYIMTNNHVVQESKKITVHMHDGTVYNAELVGTDPNTDVAILKISIDNAPYLKLCDSEHIEVGESVVAIGHPFELRATVTTGVVSAKGRSGLNINTFEDFIQTNAAINPGNSGGPLINLKGEVIGINTAILTRSGGSMGIGFSVPSNMAKHVMDQLVKTGSVSRGFLGVAAQDLSPELIEAFQLPKNSNGVIAVEVVPGSPADKAGLKVGDVIVSINGKPVESFHNLRNLIAHVVPGEAASIQVVREGQMLPALHVVVEDQKQGLPGTPVVLKKLGVDDMTEAQLTSPGQPEGGSVATYVVIQKVRQGTIAERHGLVPGTAILAVNNIKITSLGQLAEVIDEQMESGQRLLLLVRKGNTTRFITLKP